MSCSMRRRRSLIGFSNAGSVIGGSCLEVRFPDTSILRTGLPGPLSMPRQLVTPLLPHAAARTQRTPAEAGSFFWPTAG
jgi:hypothetical protein